MTRAELKELYVKAAIRARAKPQKSEEDVWFKEFEYASPRDLDVAIDSHFKQSEWMPKESVLKPMVEQAQRARLAKGSQEQMLVRWICPDCQASCCDFIEPNDYKTRRCHGFPQKKQYAFGEICGAAMNEVHRERYESKELIRR